MTDREALVERERANLIHAITHGHVDVADWKAYDAAALAVVEAEQGTEALARDGCCPHPMMDRVHVTRDQCDHDCHNPLVSFATVHELVRIAFERGQAEGKADQGTSQSVTEARAEALRAAGMIRRLIGHIEAAGLEPSEAEAAGVFEYDYWYDELQHFERLASAVTPNA